MIIIMQGSLELAKKDRDGEVLVSFKIPSCDAINAISIPEQTSLVLVVASHKEAGALTKKFTEVKGVKNSI